MGQVLVRNAIINVMGRVAPLLVAIFVIPILIKGMGVERFGILSLAWMLVGYFSLFDLGIGRALTKMVAEKLGTGNDRELPQVIWTSLLLMLILGAIGALVLGLLSPWLAYKILKIPVALQEETLHTFYLLALSVPVVICSACLRGVLEAKQRFGLINLVSIGIGSFTYLAPALVLLISNRLLPIVAVLVVVRLVVFGVFLFLCLDILPSLRKSVAVNRQILRPLLHFGGWLTVSNILSPLMDKLDRFLIGSLISVSAVAYYVTPYEVVTKFWIIPSAVAGVMFPAFSTSFAQDCNRTAMLFSRAVKSIVLLLFPIVLIVLMFAEESLTLWLGQEFAQKSTFVLQCLSLGIFVNSIAYISSALIQGVGRPDWTAKLHLLELPFYLICVWWMTSAFGIKGAAMAWLLRAAVDMIFLFVVVRHLLPAAVSTIQRIALILPGSLLILGLAMMPKALTASVAFLFVVLPVYMLTAWFLILDAEERLILRGWVRGGFISLRGIGLNISRDK